MMCVFYIFMRNRPKSRIVASLVAFASDHLGFIQHISSYLYLLFGLYSVSSKDR